MPTVRLAVMLFTRDLWLRDNPALDAAVRRAQAVVPLFVLDDRLDHRNLAAGPRGTGPVTPQAERVSSPPQG
jgi:deoxyribodipyrimidine photolyase